MFLALIIAGLVVVSMVAGGGGEDAPQTAAAPTQPPLSVTAKELFAAYEANEAAAQAQYGGRPLRVTGTVAGVDLDFMDNPVVKLETSNQFMPAQADLVESAHAAARSLAKGTEVTLNCSGVSEVVGMPMLKECSF